MQRWGGGAHGRVCVWTGGGARCSRSHEGKARDSERGLGGGWLAHCGSSKLGASGHGTRGGATWRKC